MLSKDIVLRVTQLDIAQIDTSLFNVLQSEVKLLLEKDSLFVFLLRFEPELNAIIQYIIWKLSTKKNGRTTAQEMFSTEYVALGQNMSSRQRDILGFTTILLPWVKGRFLNLKNILTRNTQFDIDLFDNSYVYIETILKILALLNFVIFLRYGKRASILQRLLSLDHVFKDKAVPRYIDYAYMQKELVWDSIVHTLVCIIPYVNFRKLKNNWANFNRWVLNQPVACPRNRLVCQVCIQKATNPYAANCEHIFCYYCVQANLLSDSNYACPTCGITISEALPLELV